MRPITWLHVSDLHLRTDTAWSQDIVLTALLQHLREAHTDTPTFAFALVTGDIAFSGRADEYSLAKDFFSAFQSAASLEPDRIFCVPGNHDVDRTRQNLCFRGARDFLQDVGEVDHLLSGGDDLSTLLSRQEHYREFEASLFSHQGKVPTPDGLGYVARITVRDIAFGILGLNSAWLAEGGPGDHHNLLIGERQALDATTLIQEGLPPPHIVIALAHHPLHLLRDFERGPMQNIIDTHCHFFHCGHLHDPGNTLTGSPGNHCVTVAAGSAFVSRDFHNAYSTVTLDVEEGVAQVRVFQYDGRTRTFSLSNTESFPVKVFTAGTCSITDLVSSLDSYSSSLSPLSAYIAALLLGVKTDVAIPRNNSHIFASFEAMENLADGLLVETTRSFFSFRHVLRAMYGRLPLKDILQDHEDKIERYFQALQNASQADPELWERLLAYDADARDLVSGSSSVKESYSDSLFAELTEEGEWHALREMCERHLRQGGDLNRETVPLRYYGLALSNSLETLDKSEATEVYRELSNRHDPDHTDFGNLALLLLESGDYEDAKRAVVSGIQEFPHETAYFGNIGQKIVEESGDRKFRARLNEVLRKAND